MSRPPIEIDGPHRPRRAMRRAASRWAVVVVLALVAALCIVAPPAIAAAIHFGGTPWL